MPLEILIGNHQSAVSVPERWLYLLETAAAAAWPLALAAAAVEDPPLAHLGTVDVALVDDAASDRVHREFMDIEGATDVITFHHGEIVIGAEVAARQAAEYGEPLLRELLRYIVHGLLHLAGHEDLDPPERASMEAAQEEIVAKVWTEAHAAACG